MTTTYYLGPSATADQLAARLGDQLSREFPAAPQSGDVVFLDARASAEAAVLPGGNAFSACRMLKEDPRVRVFLLIAEDDRYAAEIARFCLADGCVLVASGGGVGGLDAVETCLAAVRERTPIDELLESLEREIASDAGKRDSAIQRMLDAENHDWGLSQLTDPATGLFGGPFASFKLEEEFKRAVRFHQPLSLVLLDLGLEPSVVESNRLDGCLAEAASVFLNECRDIDVLARFTETTFLFLLPGTGGAGAAVVARRMLDGLMTRLGADGIALQPRAGLATIPAATVRNRAEFLARAEACLRLAQQGRSPDGLCVSCE